MRAQRAPGPTVEKSNTRTPSRWGAAAIGFWSSPRLEVLGQAEAAPRDDVLLDLRGAAADRLHHRRAVGRVEAAACRRASLVEAELARGARDVEPGVRGALRELRRVELVLRRLDRRRLRTHLAGGDEAEPEDARHLVLRRELGDPLAHHRILAQGTPVEDRRAHVLAEQLEAGLDRRVGEHREA